MSIYKRTDDNIVTMIAYNDIQRIKLAKIDKYEQALQLKRETEKYIEYFLMNHPEPIILNIPNIKGKCYYERQN